MNTSKDKIDQLFQQKLKNVEKTPRPQAWEKLAARLGEKEKSVIPIWRNRAIAASIAILFLMGGIGYFNFKTTKIESQELANIGKKAGIITKKPLIDNPKKLQLVPNKIGFEKEAVGNNTLANNTIHATTFKTAISNNKNLNIKEKLKPQLKEEVIEKEIAQNIEDKKDFNNVLKNELPSITTEDNNIAVIENKVVETKNSTIKQEDLTIVLTLNDYANNEPKTEKLEEKKAPFFSRIFQQLKNAKNGEKVDWNEIGFKPAKLLARAETKFTKAL